jgi:hypothetical protein
LIFNLSFIITVYKFIYCKIIFLLADFLVTICTSFWFFKQISVWLNNMLHTNILYIKCGVTFEYAVCSAVLKYGVLDCFMHFQNGKHASFHRSIKKMNSATWWCSTHTCITLLRFNCKNGDFKYKIYFSCVALPNAWRRSVRALFYSVITTVLDQKVQLLKPLN